MAYLEYAAEYAAESAEYAAECAESAAEHECTEYAEYADHAPEYASEYASEYAEYAAYSAASLASFILSSSPLSCASSICLFTAIACSV